MKAFLKRRWILLSWALVLAVSSSVDCVREHRLAYPPVNSFLTNEERTRSGLFRGAFLFQRAWRIRVTATQEHDTQWSFHLPTLGASPQLRSQITTLPDSYQQDRIAMLPIWLPLSVILGWIVIRELHWREKRAKAAQAPGL